MTITAGVTEVGEVLPNGQRPLPSLGCAFGFATPPPQDRNFPLDPHLALLARHPSESMQIDLRIISAIACDVKGRID